MLDSHLIPKTKPAANPGQMYISDKVRITVIAPELVRFEVSDSFVFCDEATQIVWFRDLGECKFDLVFKPDHIMVVTSKAKYYYHRKKRVVDIVEIDGEIIKTKEGNLKGTARTLDNTNGWVPLGKGVVGRKGVAIMEDNSLILGSDGMVKERPSEKDYYVFATKDHRKAVSLFYSITGNQPMIPRFALGNWWSRYYAYKQDEYLALMDKFNEKEIPFTVATVDMDWHYVNLRRDLGVDKVDGRIKVWPNGWTGYTWNKNLFPDYKQFLKDLKERNMKVTLNLHPASGVRYFEEQYPKMCEYMGMDPEEKKTIPFDMTDSEFINAYFKVLHKPFERAGVDFWWIDWQQGKKSKLPGLDPLWACNHYHTLDIGWDGRRPITLSRYSGFGSHRYPLGFSGDAYVSWKSLRLQPYFTANAANCGYATWSHDIGGHMGGKQGDDELYLRWIQFGVFTPIMRLHSTKIALSKEPWNHPSVETQAVDALRFRHKLIPYIYSELYRNFSEGKPLCEPMYYSNPVKGMAYKARNQYFFGSKLIVCPITSPMNKKTGKAKVKIWLPRGEYTDIFTGEILTGGTYTIERDINSIPVFAKSGTILPIGTNGGNSVDNPNELELLVYRGSGRFKLYEDKGDGTDYLSGDFAITQFKVEQTEDELKFKIYAVDGNACLVPETRDYKVKFVNIERYTGAEVLKNGLHIEVETEKSAIFLKGIKPTDVVEITLVGVK